MKVEDLYSICTFPSPIHQNINLYQQILVILIQLQLLKVYQFIIRHMISLSDTSRNTGIPVLYSTLLFGSSSFGFKIATIGDD